MSSHHADQTLALTTDEDARLALMKVLLSDGFARAQRMRELLRFLVEQRLSGSQRDTNEYAVGIEVFKRDAATYNTCTDPIVRVQIGRLRERLRDYYAAAGRLERVRFIIPVGSYMPEIAVMAEAAAAPIPVTIPVKPATELPMSIAARYQLGHCALQYFDHDTLGAAFTRGLNEELVHQLYRNFGATIVPHAAAAKLVKVSHRLEGSVRLDGAGVRLNLRLVDSLTGSMVWSRQFDGGAGLSIDLQDQLAASACEALNDYFDHG